ncbi:zinc finger protein 771-like [Parambassis ranga]|uniref:Zinc finger protein 771-like n=1 Tax=Parambassis ranga TaxID=210632 RepID=A0A6P7K137_9TELE|nr:zinc finger protein 771-like [Parambassis ranga]
MSGLQGLKAFISQRLTAALDDILGHFDRTIREYEEELDRRHRDLLDVVLTADTKPSRADVQQVLVPSEPQRWSYSVDREEQEDARVKEEQQEEAWTHPDVAGFPSSPVKDDEDKPESSQLHYRQRAPCREPGPARLFGPESEAETELSDEDCRQSRGPGNQDDAPVAEAGKKSFICSECGRRFGRKDSLRRHMRFHTGERPYSCSICGKRFSQRPNLIRHLRCHSGEKPFSCSFCDTSFAVRSALVNHLRIHTGEKPFSCLHCEKSFTQKGGLKKHMTVHTGEKPYSCPVCGKSFSQKANLTYHFSVHTGQKQFSCSVCHKRFTWQSQVKSHKCVGMSGAFAVDERPSGQTGSERLQGLKCKQ